MEITIIQIAAYCVIGILISGVSNAVATVILKEEPETGPFLFFVAFVWPLFCIFGFFWLFSYFVQIGLRKLIGILKRKVMNKHGKSKQT